MSELMKREVPNSDTGNLCTSAMKRLALILLLALGIFLSTVVQWNYRNNLKDARSNYQQEEHSKTVIIANTVEDEIEEIYQGLRTIARLPGVRRIDRHAEEMEYHGGGSGLGDNALQAVQEIYYNLANNVAMSEVYIVPVGFDPDIIDPMTGELQRPIVTFDKLITGHQGDEIDGSVGKSDLEEIEIFEYRMMQQQLAWLGDHMPRVETVEGLNYPALGSSEVVTCDNSRYFAGRSGDEDRSGMVYSVPFYGEDGLLRGCVTGVILTAALKDLLPAEHFVLVNVDLGYFIHSEGDDQMKDSAAFVEAGLPDPSLFYSEVIQFDVRDEISVWSLWSGLSNDHFWKRSDVITAEQVAWGAHLGAWILVVGLGIVFYLVQRNRMLLITRSHELETKVEHRTRALTNQHKELLEANRLLEKAQTRVVASMNAKSEFLANMSHEIRTPLNGILGFTDLLLRGADGGEETERQEWLTIMKTSGQHLLALINDILDLSKIESGKLEVECITVSPHRVIAEVASMMRPRALEKDLSLDIKFEGPFPSTIQSDPTRLRQLLVNLVGNGIKFTDEGSVRMVARLGKDEPQMIEVDIIDTGIGIPEDKRGEIFDPFKQADSTVTRHFGGTGLGLTISRRIAEALGGELMVRSEEGKGSTFTVRLTTGSLEHVELIQRENAEAIFVDHGASKVDQPSTLRGKILLVEDGQVNRKLIGLLLRRAGLEVSMAEHGQAGVEKARRESFDLILMDMQMPVIDGYRATRTLRSEGFTLPIIALTAHAMRGDEERCKEAGCTGYLTKPVDGDELLRMVAQSLGQDDSGSKGALEREPIEEVVESMESALVSTLGMDDPEFRDIVLEFTSRLSDQLKSMQKAYEERDMEALERLAHWLKGSGGTVGLGAFTEPAMRLEELVSTENFDGIESILVELRGMAGRIVVDCPGVVNTQ